ncbi:NAD(P)/FAD-dependent oxidoreductase [Mycolicibacterium komossense]|uniref:FAD-binding oxidoreductase n=1 Tax=Mycolicibacterium komossense TaxID=1779 RepID=A0ABT3CBW4_9MYCO|nr:FAD-binding oxidoreductase [Mycolicibacterium komossense]MCV7226972.1 FAD-binding oxidoreductase [Mycolicibacterium komossense]
MTTAPSVVVIGAGVLGLSTALELINRGSTDVHVIERSHPGEGSSGRSVGMVETQYFRADDIEARVYGRRFYDRLAADHGLGFVSCGYLRLGSTAADIDTFEDSLKIQRDFGVVDARVMTADDIAGTWPQLVTSDRIGGLYGASDGYIDGYEYCTLAARMITAAGARISTKTELLGADVDANGRWRLATSKGFVEADVVVNAAGAWGARVGERLGAPIALHPQLHGAITVDLRSPMDPLLPFVMDYVPDSGTDGVYFRSERVDQLIAGLHTDEGVHEPVSPDVSLRRVGDADVERVLTLMAERLHIVDDLTISGSWQGIYPMSPDHRPIVGRHPDQPTVICALGAGGSGIQLAPSIGVVAADAVLDADPIFTWSPTWAPDRVIVGTPAHPSA